MENYLKGTTCVGLVCKDGIVLAAEKRASMGSLVVHKEAVKIYKIDNYVGATIAGLVADAQRLIRLLKAETQLYKVTRGESMKVEAMATLLANIMFSQRWFPYISQLLVGGIDNEGKHLFAISFTGDIIEDNMIATGSGSPIAYGILEGLYKEDLTVEEGKKLAVKAVKAATERDVFSGEGIDVVVINEGGYNKLSKEEIKKIVEGPVA
ncbi:MAG: archaeal proteasome endopeptidase complex subunit beta [Candidatus Hydrothermarchaeota archaeon]